MAAADYTSVVQSIYISYFGRPADTFGLQNFAAQLDALKAPTTTAGLTSAYASSPALKKLIDSFGASDESVALYGTDTVNFVNQIYVNVLNRPSDFDGLKFWVNEINSGRLTKGNAALSILNGALENTSAQGIIDGKVVSAKVAIATAFTTAIDTSAELVGYNGNAAAATARDMLKTVNDTSTVTGFQTTIANTLTNIVNGSVVTVPALLTVGADILVGTAANDVFNASGETLTALDKIDGGSGINTLNIIDPTAGGTQNLGLPALVKLANIQNVNVTTVGGVGTVAAGAVTAAAETKTYTFAIPAASGDTMAVSYNGGAATTTAALGASANSAATAFAAALNSAASASIATVSGAVVTVTAPAAGTALSAIAITAATATADVPVVATTQANVAAVAAVAAAVYDVSSVTGLTNYVVSANAGVNTKVAGTTNVDLTTTKGAVTVSGGLTIKSTGATGAESFTGAALTSVNATGGTTVAVSDLASGTLTSVTLSGNSGTATLTGDALTSVSLSKSTASATVANATVGHTLNLALNQVGSGTVSPTVTDAEATTVNLSVTGAKSTTASFVDLTAAKATTLNINNAATLTLKPAGALASADALTSLTIKGAGTTTANMTGVATLASVDASASTGKNTLTVDNIAALSIKGGSGADSVTVNGALDAKGVVNLGEGNDTYTFTTAAAAGALVSGGVGTDTLAVANGALINAAAANVYSGFETLSVSGGQGTYDMSILGLTAVTAATALTGATIISGAAAGTTISLSSAAATALTTGQDLTFALKDATGTADSASLSLTATEGTTSNGIADGSVTVTKFIAAAIEKVSIVSNVSAVDVDDAATVFDESTIANQYVNTVTNLTAANATTVTVSGAASTVLTAINSDVLVRIDATAATGNVTVGLVHAADGTTAAGSSITYLGGSGVDTYTASAKGDLIAGNAGADIITLSATAAKDTLSYAKASDSILTLKDTSLVADGIADTAKGFDTVTNFVGASDKIDLSALVLASGAGRGALTLLTLSADTAAGLQSLIGTGLKFFNDGVANRDVAYATGGGAGYVFVDANGDGNFTAGTDLVIKLVGAPALVVTDISFG